MRISTRIRLGGCARSREGTKLHLAGGQLLAAANLPSSAIMSAHSVQAERVRLAVTFLFDPMYGPAVRCKWFCRASGELGKVLAAERFGAEWDQANVAALATF